MFVKTNSILIYFILTTFVGVLLFLYGFFPISHSNGQRASLDDLPVFIDNIPLNASIYEPHVSRSIFLVIDALRTDFIQNNQNASLKYVNQLLANQSACINNIGVENPTVTMPRIKAITTGTIPNFIDVVLNLGSAELYGDSILHQLHGQGNRIVFSGDNTWTKMFPDLFTRQHENHDSLFVNDFYEGDNNITKVMNAELELSDWRLLILHYLGLDHIGHVEGPFSAKVPNKLREMDDVVRHIHSVMLKWIAMRRLPKPPLLLITGDHGMRDTGGHGGSSFAETNVPLIFIGAGCRQSYRSYKQIDIAPTLSTLFGHPIPATSIGTLIPDLLVDLSLEQKLYAYYYNGKRLLQKAIEIDGHETVANQQYYRDFVDAQTAHKSILSLNGRRTEIEPNANNELRGMLAERKYLSAAQAMSDRLAKTFVTYDDMCIGLGLAFLLTSIIGIASLIFQSNRMISVSCSGPLLVMPPLYLLQLTICTTYAVQSTVCNRSAITFAWMAALCLLLAISVQLNYKLIRLVDSALLLSINSLKFGEIAKFMVVGLGLQAVSTASSSFIEEEHQIWYYFNYTMLICFWWLEVRALWHQRQRQSNDFSIRPTWLLSWSQLQWMLVFGGHLIARRLNQTGDKWLSVPDIGDWLQMPEHRLANSLFVGGSLFAMHLAIMDFAGILTNVLTVTASLLIYYYRALTGSVDIAGIRPTQHTDTCLLLFWLNIVEIVGINCVPIAHKLLVAKARRHDAKDFIGTIIVCLALIVALTHKPHNILLVAVLLCTCQKVSRTCTVLFGYHRQWEPIVGLMVHMWLGKAAFFYQGNSNSLASIDLNAGYIGLSTFHFGPVAALLTINTFSGPILAFLSFVYHFYEGSTDQSIRHVLRVMCLIIVMPFLCYAFIVLAFRQHLFIWSVFSPKLLYESYFLVLMLLLTLFVYLLHYFE